MKRLLLLLCFANVIVCTPAEKPSINASLDERLRKIAHKIQINKYRLERACSAASAVFFAIFTTGLLMHRAQESSDDSKSAGEQVGSALPILLTAACTGCSLYYLEKYT